MQLRLLYEPESDLGGVWEPSQNRDGRPPKDVGSKLGRSGARSMAPALRTMGMLCVAGELLSCVLANLWYGWSL